MPTKGPTLYSTYKTTIWFAIAGIILFVGLIAMVVQDSTREWKHWQKEFIEYSRELAEEELKEAEHAVDQKKVEELRAALEAAEANAAAKKQEIQAIESGMQPILLEITTTSIEYQNLQQNQNSEKYYFEEHRAHGHHEEAKKIGKSLEARSKKIYAAKLKLESLEAQRDTEQAKIDAISGKAKEIDLEMKRLTGEVTRIEGKIERLTPDWRDSVLNAPMMDFIKPSLQIQQIVLDDLHDDYYFVKANKVDRCITCHLGIDQKAYEDAPVPFKAHPRLDLFVSADSPHPMEEFGCTTCHGGSGHSVNFTTAAHTPQNEEQAKDWKEKYHWHKMKHAPDKMFPLQYVEASCAKCHTDTFIVPEAKKLNKGRELARTFGCFNCHKVEGFEDYWNAGPSLTNIQSKVEADWIVRWLHNPKEFRPSTKMPQVFHLENTSDEESRAKSNAAIAGIATYLMKNSESVSLQKPKAKGNPEVGKKLVADLGCMGCHGVEGKQVSIHGPELNHLGSKVTEEWLFTWLKNPKHYSDETRMPDMRLSDEEASDIAAYLLADKNEKFDSMRLPHVEPEVVDALALKFLTGTRRHEEATAELNKMSAEERLEFIGKKTIQHQGCYGCHTIKGFEDMSRIGAELTKEGSKDVHRFEFNFVDIPHTRQDWIYQKIKEPRSFDRGKEKEYLDKLKMPEFGFDDAQTEALTTFVLSLVDTEIPLSKKKILSEAELEVERGRNLIAKLNCQGCHTLDGVDGEARELFDDIGNAPPILDGEGIKVQPNWLYHFLDKPVPIRPWLSYRMPTFGLSDEELKLLVQYFNHLDAVPQSFVHAEGLEIDAETHRNGKKLFESFQCIKCHKSNPEPGLSASFLAPDLVMSKERLRPEWVSDWLWDPQALQPGTMMPGFFPDGQSPIEDMYGGDAKKQVDAIRDYLWKFNGEDENSTPEPKAKAPAKKKPAQEPAEEPVKEEENL